MTEPTTYACPCRAVKSGTITRCYCRKRTVHPDRPCADCRRHSHMDESGNAWSSPEVGTRCLVINCVCPTETEEVSE